MAKKHKKQAWEIVLKDRFLTNEKPDNPYVTALLYFVVFFLSFLLVFVCFFQLCEVRGNSMLNTLQNGDHVLLLKVSETYERNDTVVITKDRGDGTSMNIIKRVVGVGGDTLKFDLIDPSASDSEVRLSIKYAGTDEFVVLNETYIAEPMQRNMSFPSSFTFGEEIEVDKGFVFVMGDNRNHSEDSRADGAYAVQNVYCKSILTVPKGSLLEWLLKLLYHENNAAA